MITNEKLTEIKERVEETPFDKAYVKGDPWKGYEIRNEGNGQTIAETSSGTDAEFIAHAYEDIPMLVAEVERLKSAMVYACEMISIGESRKANEKLCEALGVPDDYFEEEFE